MADGRITDPKELRALSHPFRWKLIQLLTEEGQATATRCSERLGDSVASCSYHLNMLAKYGFVEEVAGPGRQKPWRLIRRDQSFSREGLDDEAALAAEAAAFALLDKEFDEIKNRLRHSEHEPEEWRRSLGLTSTVAFITAEELDGVREEIQAILQRYESRHEKPETRPDGVRPVRLFLSTSVAPEK